MHGYDLLERARARGMGSWAEVGKASVYQARCTGWSATGAVAGRAQEGPEGPDRRVSAKITGRPAAAGGLDERFEQLAPYETDGGLALGFVHLLPAADARRALDARERAVRDLLDTIEPSAHGRRTTATSAARAGRRDARAPGARRRRARVDQGFRASLGKLRR
ncbi:MAG: hypothetical protein U0V56_08515 [Actinomycetota bacterium]